MDRNSLLEQGTADEAERAGEEADEEVPHIRIRAVAEEKTEEPQVSPLE